MLYDNILAINAVHRVSPTERLSVHDIVADPARHDPLLILPPNFLKHLECAEVIEEATFLVNLDASLANDGAMHLIDALSAGDEQRPKQKLVHAACNANLRDVIQ